MNGWEMFGKLVAVVSAFLLGCVTLSWLSAFTRKAWDYRTAKSVNEHLEVEKNRSAMLCRQLHEAEDQITALESELQLYRQSGTPYRGPQPNEEDKEESH